jgi:hypothetical protein
MAIVDPVLTPMSRDELRAGIAQSAPTWTSNQVEMFTALALIETAQGKKVIQYNIGNIAAGGYVAGVEKLWTTANIWRPAWYEDTASPLHATMLAGKAPSAFRAYHDKQEGINAFVATLQSKRYDALREAAKAGDVAAFVRELKAYSPDYGPKHVTSFESLTAGRLDIGKDTGTPKHLQETSDGAGVAVVAVVLLIAAIGGAVLMRRRK